MFPRKMVFEKNSVLTLEMNRVVSLILSASNTSGGSKKEKYTDFGVLSCGVEPEAVFFTCKYSDFQFVTGVS